MASGNNRWYVGKILRAMEDDQFEVDYCDDDQGPYVLNLFEDFPQDIRVVSR